MHLSLLAAEQILTDTEVLLTFGRPQNNLFQLFWYKVKNSVDSEIVYQLPPEVNAACDVQLRKKTLLG